MVKMFTLHIRCLHLSVYIFYQMFALHMKMFAIAHHSVYILYQMFALHMKMFAIAHHSVYILYQMFALHMKMLSIAHHWGDQDVPLRAVFFSSPELCSGWAIVITFRPCVNIFKRLLLWSRWANFAQISYGTSLGWGNERLLKWSRYVDQDGRHAHTW